MVNKRGTKRKDGGECGHQRSQRIQRERNPAVDIAYVIDSLYSKPRGWEDADRTEDGGGRKVEERFNAWL